MNNCFTKKENLVIIFLQKKYYFRYYFAKKKINNNFFFFFYLPKAGHAKINIINNVPINPLIVFLTFILQQIFF
jgi:hypothetical protein